MKLRTRKAALSLAELLVVLAIIILLTSLMIPALRRSTRSAKQTVCLSNLRQFYMALQLYRDTYGEYPPNDLMAPGLSQHHLSELKCPDYTGRGRSYWTFWPRNDEGSSYRRALWDCYQSRGPQYPLMMDMNHASQTLGVDHIESGNVLVLRDSGAVVYVPGKSIGKIETPCDTRILPPFMND